MNPIVFELQSHLVLLVVDFSLKQLPVLRQSHVFIFKWQGLQLLLERSLLNTAVRQFVNKLIKIFSAVIVSNVFVLS